MEAQDLQQNNNDNKKTRSKDENPVKKKSVTKLQAFLILFVTLIACLVGGYFISEKYLWPNADEQHLLDQLDYYKGLVDKKPNDPENRVNLGYTYFLTGDNDNAVKQLKIASGLDKNYFGAYFNLGLVYISEKRYDEALIQSQKAIDLGPKNFKSHLLAGMSYRNLKMYSQANKSLQKALDLNPTNTDIIAEMGKVYEAQGKYDQAEKLFKQALSYDPLYKPATKELEKIAAKTKK